jgi:hypothetical protein
MFRNTRVQMAAFLAVSALLGYGAATGKLASLLGAGEEKPAAPGGGPQVPPPTTAAEVPGPAPGPWTKEYVQMVGRMAYIWGWPLAVQINQRATHADVKEPMMVNGIGVAPVNHLVMWHDYVDPRERHLGDPNQDVLYGLSYLDLGKEPVVVQVPEFGDPYWVIEVEDARADEFSKLGKQYGTKAGFYLIAGPNWQGATPDGIAGVLRSSTNGAISFPRIFMADSAEDRKAIQPLINQILFYRLSAFDGKMKTKDWSEIPEVKKEGKPAKYSNTQPPWVDPETFFEQLPKIMKEVPPLPGEEKLYEWIKSVLEAAAKDPEVMKTLRETAFAADKELIQPMTKWRYSGQPAGNGWTAPKNLGAFGTDYIHRAGMMYAGPYDGRVKEVTYFFTDNDSELRQLNGTSLYAVSFPKGQLPPLKGFWSLTLYDPEDFFYANDLKRYSIGTKNEKTLKYDADGGLTLYLGNKSPGKDKESNWIPAPAAEFSLWLRAYWPGKPYSTEPGSLPQSG